MLLQVKLGFKPTGEWRMSVWGKYLAFRIWLRREVGETWSLQTCLASMALLNKCISLKPNPPLKLGLNNSDLAFQWILLLLIFPPHQNLQIAFSI
ncbi:hypothetical protein QL285_096774 [Trifolium repens]|nr:hypothetical protein QL285_096774 [Trifolium repens]